MSDFGLWGSTARFLDSKAMRRSTHPAGLVCVKASMKSFPKILFRSFSNSRSTSEMEGKTRVESRGSREVKVEKSKVESRVSRVIILKKYKLFNDVCRVTKYFKLK